MLDVVEIRDRIPHRYPFLLVDRVLEIDAKERVLAIKNVTINEPFFNGHYPDRPVMPGVLIAEAMAQVGGLMFFGVDEFTENALPLLVGIDSLRFKRLVVPGDQLRIEANIVRFRRNIAKVKATAHVGDELAAEGELMFAIRAEDEINA